MALDTLCSSVLTAYTHDDIPLSFRYSPSCDPCPHRAQTGLSCFPFKGAGGYFHNPACSRHCGIRNDVVSSEQFSSPDVIDNWVEWLNEEGDDDVVYTQAPR